MLTSTPMTVQCTIYINHTAHWTGFRVHSNPSALMSSLTPALMSASTPYRRPDGGRSDVGVVRHRQGYYAVQNANIIQLLFINYCMCIDHHSSLVLTGAYIQYTPLVDASIGSEESASVVLHLTLSRHMPSEAERAHIRTYQC